MERPARLVLENPRQVRAVASPVAHQIVSVMERVRSCTVAELGDHTGIDARSLYYHVRQLRRAGVLVERGERSTGGRRGAVYELAGDEVVLGPGNGSPAFERELARSVRTRLRYVERAYLQALDRSETVRGGRGRNLSLHQHHARLRPRDRAELYRRIEELERFLVAHDDPGAGDFLSVTVAVLPVAKRRAPGAR